MRVLVPWPSRCFAWSGGGAWSKAQGCDLSGSQLEPWCVRGCHVQWRIFLSFGHGCCCLQMGAKSCGVKNAARRTAVFSAPRGPPPYL